MDVTLTVDHEFEKELRITVPWEAVRSDYEQLIKRYSGLPVKGFRPGKIPSALLESIFAPRIKNDLLAAASTRLCRKALEDKGLQAGTPVEISDGIVRKNESLQFTAAFIAMPVFGLPDYSSLDLQAGNKAEKLDEISQKLIERTEIQLHPCYVENELRYSETDGVKEREQAEARVKLMLILKKIAAQDGIEVDENDLSGRIDSVAAENGITSDELRSYLIENQGLSRFADSLLAETVLDYIIEIQP